MKSIRPYLILTVFLCCLSASAQRQLVIVDVETLVPIGGANVVCKDFSMQADTLGYVTVPDSCPSILFSHVNYESRLINVDEIRDTVFLISKLLNLKEVVVFGKAPHMEDYQELNKRLQPSKLDLQLAAAQPSGMNLFGLFGYLVPKKWKKSAKQKRKERLKRILEEY